MKRKISVTALCFILVIAMLVPGCGCSKKKYYFKSNGVMAKSCTMKIKGKKYKFNAKGQLVK